MLGEKTIPLLPCADIDEIEDFSTALGFVRGFRQLRPNPYLAPHRRRPPACGMPAKRSPICGRA